MKAALAFVLIFFTAASAAGAERRPIDGRKGTEGLAPAPISIANGTDGGIACVGELAHWHSAELAAVAAGDTAVIALWHDPETGTFTALNDKQENMPVESLWCGVAGKAYETRALVALPRQAGTAPALRLTCSMGKDRLACE